MLMQNSYPLHMIEKVQNNFKRHHKINKNNFNPPTIPEHQDKPVDTSISYIKLPYFGKPSRTLQRRIQQQFQQHDVDVNIAFTTTKISSYFSLKSKCSILFQSNVVYKFTCVRDERTSYVGETRRQLFKRILDHGKGIDKNSAVFGHIKNCNDCQNIASFSNAFKVLQQCNFSNIYATEAILISKLSPSLNTQLGPNKGKVVTLSLFD